MRQFVVAFAGLCLAMPAAAQVPTPSAAQQEPVKLHVGQVIRDGAMTKIGPISAVEPDGSVQVIYEQRILTLPAATLSVVDGKPRTSLSRHDLTGR